MQREKRKEKREKGNEQRSACREQGEEGRGKMAEFPIPLSDNESGSHLFRSFSGEFPDESNRSVNSSLS